MIATRTGGVAEVVTDGENGLVVEPGDVDALTAAIAHFFADEELAARLRANAAARSPATQPGGSTGGWKRDPVGAASEAARPLRRPHALPAAAEGGRASKWDALAGSWAARARERQGATRASGSVGPRHRRPRSSGDAPGRGSGASFRSFDPEVVVAESVRGSGSGAGRTRHVVARLRSSSRSTGTAHGHPLTGRRATRARPRSCQRTPRRSARGTRIAPSPDPEASFVRPALAAGSRRQRCSPRTPTIARSPASLPVPASHRRSSSA